MTKSKVYTRTGDKLTTSLLGGERVPKCALRLDTYGTVDELSSFIGVLAAAEDVPGDLRANLLKVQNMLFNIGAYLANPKAGRETEVAGLSDANIAEMEEWIDVMDASLPAVTNFIIPGGCRSSAYANVARAVCRRAERRLSEFAEGNPVNPLVSAYVNRLSDYLFVVGRYMNKINDFEEIMWQKPVDLK